MTNIWNQPSYVNNSNTIRAFMELYRIMGCVVFHLIPILCNSDKIWAIIIIIRIKYWFMRVTIYILNAALETLVTMNIRCHSLVSHMECCVANVNSAHKSNVLYPDKSMSKFSMILHLYLTRGNFLLMGVKPQVLLHIWASYRGYVCYIDRKSVV